MSDPTTPTPATPDTLTEALPSATEAQVVAEEIKLILHNHVVFGSTLAILQRGSGNPPTPGAEQTEADIDTVQRYQALIEAAFLVAGADGELSGPEEDRLAAALIHLSDGSVTQDDISTLLDSFIELAAQDGFDARIKQITDLLPSPEERRGALALALHLARTDQSISPEEDRVLRALAASFGIGEAELAQLLAATPQRS